MTIQFVLLVNKQGQTRLARYTDSSLTTDERRALEAEIVRLCLTRVDKQASRGHPGPPVGVCALPATATAAPAATRRHPPPLSPACPAPAAPLPAPACFLQCNIVEHRNYKVVYRRYASLFFLMGIDAEEASPQPLPPLLLQRTAGVPRRLPCLPIAPPRLQPSCRPPLPSFATSNQFPPLTTSLPPAPAPACLPACRTSWACWR